MNDNGTNEKTRKTNEPVELIQGLTPVDPAVLEDFLREMNEEVIPEIVKDVEERRVLAAESRQWHLKC